MANNLKEIGKRIFLRRKELDLSQKELANKINVSNNHLSNIERGKSAPSFLLFLDICSVLKTNTDYIVSGTVYADLDDEIIQKIKRCSDEDKRKISQIIDVFLWITHLHYKFCYRIINLVGYTIFFLGDVVLWK